MFHALETVLSNSEFVQAWKKSSVFEQIIGKSPPPVIREEFSEKWAEDLKDLIGDSPFTSRFLALVAHYIEEIRTMEGYEHVKQKLEWLDEQFYPTVSEIEFIDFLLEKLASNSIHLECTFETPGGKHPELMVDFNSNQLYFEVTRIMNYHEMNAILSFHSMMTAFQLSLKVLEGIDRTISITFKEVPWKERLERVTAELNKQLSIGGFDCDIERPDFSASMSEGSEVLISIPPQVFENKLKDKLDKESDHFDQDTCNIVVIDATPMVSTLSTLGEMIEKYFDYSGNNVISSVVLFSKKWILKELGRPKFSMELLGIPNRRVNICDIAESLFNRLLRSE